MPGLRRPKSPEPAARGVFSYHYRGGFRAYGHLRASPDKLVDVDPNKSKNWLMAQLAHYGIPFDPEYPESLLRAILTRTALATKHLERPPELVSCEHILGCDYRRRELEHYAIMETWKWFEFEELGSPTEKILYNLRAFVRWYFLDGYGRPDPSKTPETLVLDIAPIDGLGSFVGAIPGLRVYITPSITVMGWGHAMVRGIAAAFASIDRPGYPLHVPTAEANFDPLRFLQKYFAAGEGPAARRELTGPIELGPLLSAEQKSWLGCMVGFFPALKMADVESRRGPHTVVGWREHVDALCRTHAEGDGGSDGPSSADKEHDIDYEEYDIDYEVHLSVSMQIIPAASTLSKRSG